MWSVIAGLGALQALSAVCRRVRVGSRFHRALVAFSLVPGARVGVNALAVACVGWLGLPGLGLLQVIAIMPVG